MGTMRSGPRAHRFSCTAWFLSLCARYSRAGADEHIRKATQGVNGALRQLLARKIGYHDKGCVDLLRYGAPLVGALPFAGRHFPLFVRVQCVLLCARQWRSTHCCFG